MYPSASEVTVSILGALYKCSTFYVYAKFDDDRIWNEKALAHYKSVKNNTNTK